MVCVSVVFFWCRSPGGADGLDVYDITFCSAPTVPGGAVLGGCLKEGPATAPALLPADLAGFSPSIQGIAEITGRF
jgi:hypothetical protein